jgi:hypothetical protein
VRWFPDTTLPAFEMCCSTLGGSRDRAVTPATLEAGIVLPEVAPSLPSRDLPAALSFFHLWNLDAPSVAVLWQLLFARCLGTTISVAAVLALAVSVWLIYATDRLLDVARGPAYSLTRRHAFHWRYRKPIVAAAIAALVALASLCTLLRPVVLRSGLLLSASVGLYLVAVHFLPPTARRWFPKEFVVGALFALGTCLAPWCRAGDRPALLLPGLFFAALCCLNCVAIEVWEWRSLATHLSPPSVATLWTSRHLRVCLWSISVAALLLLGSGARSLFAAILLSSVAFLWLDSQRQRVPADLLRMLADVPLLTPLLFLR